MTVIMTFLASTSILLMFAHSTTVSYKVRRQRLQIGFIVNVKRCWPYTNQSPSFVSSHCCSLLFTCKQKTSELPYFFMKRCRRNDGRPKPEPYFYDSLNIDDHSCFSIVAEMLKLIPHFISRNLWPELWVINVYSWQVLKDSLGRWEALSVFVQSYQRIHSNGRVSCQSPVEVTDSIIITKSVETN